MQNFLEEIIRLKRKDLAIKSGNVLKKRIFKNRKFRNLFLKDTKRVKLIAEIKFASPTNANIGKPEDLDKRIKSYEKAGADAVSIITEKHFFKGDIAFVSKVKKKVKLPILQKDFIIDSRQIYEAKEIGSDAILLIVRLVDLKKLKQFVELCFELEIEPVVEINNEKDLQKAISTKTRIIAVNARDLETFTIDIASACKLLKKIPDHFIKLSFSGISSASDVLQYKESGTSGVLVGTSLMQSKNVTSVIRSFKL